VQIVAHQHRVNEIANANCNRDDSEHGGLGCIGLESRQRYECQRVTQPTPSAGFLLFVNGHVAAAHPQWERGRLSR